jgi:hypothetical protein
MSPGSQQEEPALPMVPATTTMNAMVDVAVQAEAVQVAAAPPLPPDSAVTANNTKASGTVIYDLRPSDVLLGRGSRIDQYPGNLAFRDLVNSCKQTYRTTANHETKREIAEYIIAQVEQRHQGRFLRRIEPDSNEAVSLGIATVGSNGKPKPAWIPIDTNAAIEKTKQALREKGNSSKRKLPETTPLAAQQQMGGMNRSSSSSGSSGGINGMAAVSNGISVGGGILGHNTLPFASASATASAWNQSMNSLHSQQQQQRQQLLLSSLWPRTNPDSLLVNQSNANATAALLPSALLPQSSESTRLLQAMLAAQSRSNVGGTSAAAAAAPTTPSSTQPPSIRQLLLLQQQQLERDALQQQLQQEQLRLELQRQQQLLSLRQHNLTHLLPTGSAASTFAPPTSAPSLQNVWTGRANTNTSLVDSLLTNHMSPSSPLSALTETEATLLRLLQQQQQQQQQRQQQRQQQGHSNVPEFCNNLSTRTVPTARESLLSPFRTNTSGCSTVAARDADHAAAVARLNHNQGSHRGSLTTTNDNRSSNSNGTCNGNQENATSAALQNLLALAATVQQQDQREQR